MELVEECLREWSNIYYDWAPPPMRHRGKGVKVVNLVLVGPVGQGKTSVFNTVLTAMSDHVVCAGKAAQSEEAVTTSINRQLLGPHVALWDTWGWPKGKGSDFSNKELQFLLQGTLSPSSVKNGTPDRQPNEKNAGHCVIFVLQSGSWEAEVEGVRECKGQLSLQGVPYLILLTRQERQEGYNPLLDYAKLRPALDEVAQLSGKLGISNSLVLPFVSYSFQYEKDLMLDLGAFRMIRCALNRFIDWANDVDNREGRKKGLTDRL